MFQFLKNLFSRKKLDDKVPVEKKYFEKYRDVLNEVYVQKMFEEYKSGDIIFEPVRGQITEAEQDELYTKIDNSNFLSPQERLETIIGLMMIIDGSFPEPPIVSRLGKVFGKEFIETIEKKRDEFKSEILIRKLTKFVKWKFGHKRNR